MRRLIALVLCCLGLAGPARAHPHLFMDVGLGLIFDEDGRLAALRVTWVYDDFYSLMVFEDMGLDPDYDGALTPDELARLDGFDMTWTDGFQGDVVVLAGGAEQALSGPLEHDTQVEGGRIVTTHLRAFETRQQVADDAALVIQVYDPTFFTAYHIVAPVRIENRTGCAAPIIEPDLDAAQAKLAKELARYAPSDDLEELGWPNVGADFAEEIHLTCAARS